MAAPVKSDSKTGPDADIQFEEKWWGFYIHMGKEEVETWQKIKDAIFALVEPFLGGTVGKVISAAVEVQKLWIQAVADDRGVSLVSPWVSPAMLVPIPRRGATSEDTSLWWCVYDLQERKWGPDQRFPAHYSYSTPALAEYKGNLHCVHRGHGNSDSQLWMTTFNPNGEDEKKRWSRDQAIPNHYSESGPGLATYKDELHCVYRGSGSDSRLYHIIYDGSSWRTQTMGEKWGDSGVALAVRGSELHCVRRGVGSDTKLWHSVYDGQKWTGDQPIPDSWSESGPGLRLDYDGRLWLAYRNAGGDTQISFNYYDGQKWTGDTRHGFKSAHTPALLAMGKLDWHMVYTGDVGDQRLHHSTQNGTSALEHKYSNAGPALIHYKDPYAKRDQILCVHRGHGAQSQQPSGE